MLGNLLSLAFAKQDFLNDGHANSIISRNFDNTWLLDNLFTCDHLCITSLENLLCKKVTYRINILNIYKINIIRNIIRKTCLRQKIIEHIFCVTVGKMLREVMKLGM